MGRYIESVCKMCRREGMKLFLKGNRCYSDKCAFERRSYAPGQHGQGRGKATAYATQLREKQRVKRMYGIMESQFHGYFKKAERLRGITGENLLMLLERRLDNVAYRLGFASSRNDARQLILHRHVLINGKRVNIPSYIVKPGEIVEIKEKSRNKARLNESLEAVERRGVPQWLELDKANYKGTVKVMPKRDDITMPIQEQLIVELYSK
ncbi:MAG: 30S ribosomal protein S4 [Deltaproteobacteria bacterium GWA2_42_85]|nr:MAG: 30S ribosomal protein S4 [Deltaproteobacteria bacterium GWA2_42_85]OGP26716.1 MAG: 30S ribosomal protein S4 [Deltaproteobacteria bacterium GWB2_42_7]OGP39104.1 MAG: 30S ribosomal protein S4 [Deltaproteobacteria bacterium GWD2_42_10]OGP47962.1 MAG: 30S ribosomal protein S4 [Deltaproteobacteria bacterium GWF2_42_12]OGQ24791.1 MAG: 30S ribosomal protein S4 [Deltaproteobacteria bacterium RIFCSPHIGHO2_02_FULL_42_44]OGQ36839.1 MAG: 30S ribosomal protein S4 [Deltaproteobacteria bacterium RIFC